MPNGFAGVGCAVPLTVRAWLLDELSMNELLWQVRSCVFVTAVKGVVGTVNFVPPGYKQVPAIMRALEIYPFISNPPVSKRPIKYKENEAPLDPVPCWTPLT
jgi:hypothetical protein